MAVAAKRVLIIFLSGLGNSILLRPTLRALHQNGITVDLLYENKIVPEIFKHDHFVNRYIQWSDSLGERWRLLHELRGNRYTEAIVTFESGGWKTALFARMAARYAVGYRLGRWFDFLYSRLLPLDHNAHEVHRHLTMLTHFNLPLPQHVDLALERPGSESESIIAKTDSWKRPIIVLHPGSSRGLAWKRWSLDRFVELGRELFEKWQGEILFIGGKDEEDLLPLLQSKVNYPARILIDRLSLWETANLLTKANLFIGNDCGITHLAAAVGTKTLALFGPSDPVKNRPFGENARIISRHELCRGCVPHLSLQCGLKCLDAIEVEEVLATVSEILSPKG